MDKPTKPTNLMPRSFGGIKNNFNTTLQTTGFEPNVPQIYNGANLNYQLNAIGEEFDYCETICDFINNLPIGNIITTDANNKLVYSNLSGFANPSLSNLNATGEAHFANPSLSNLNTTGEAHFANPSLSNLNTTGNQKLVPTGTIIWYATSSAPSGYLICNGAAISRTDYATLFAIIGTTFGTGNGTTTFNVPNLINKIIKGNSANINQSNTTIESTSVNLAHSHEYNMGGGYSPSLTSSKLGYHTHNTTIPTVILLPCIKY